MDNNKQISGIPLPKVCTKCGKLKLSYEFSKMKTAPDGLQYKCKLCMRAYLKDNAQHVKLKQHAAYLNRKATDPEALARHYKEIVLEFKESLELGKFIVDPSLVDRLKLRLQTETMVF